VVQYGILNGDRIFFGVDGHNLLIQFPDDGYDRIRLLGIDHGHQYLILTRHYQDSQDRQRN
jgi:hypothetical protein